MAGGGVRGWWGGEVKGKDPLWAPASLGSTLENF